MHAQRHAYAQTELRAYEARHTCMHARMHHYHADLHSKICMLCIRAKHMGSADCVATRLLAGRFCEPRRALRTSTKGNGVHEATTGGCTKGSAKAQAPPRSHRGCTKGYAKAKRPQEPTRTANCWPHKVMPCMRIVTHARASEYMQQER